MSTTTAHTARKARRCGSYRCLHTIEPGEPYLRHVAFPGDDGYEEGTRPRVMEECRHCIEERTRFVGVAVATVVEWNSVHPVGTAVVAYPGARDGRAVHGVTRSLAWNLGEGYGTPVVLVEGLSGYIALTHVDVVGPAPDA